MVQSFINPTLSRAELGVSPFAEIEPLVLNPKATESEIDIVIRAVYRQVLGNAHVMDSERLAVAESQLKNKDISVREFVRQIAKSDFYRSRFFLNCSRNRAVELNFKHLLGRAPESYEEIIAHTRILDGFGYEAEIDSYIDSDEYLENFGQHIVPYYRGYRTQTGKNGIGFPHMFRLLRGYSSSDQDIVGQNRSRLNWFVMTNTSGSIVPLEGVPSYWQLLFKGETEKLLERLSVKEEKKEEKLSPTAVSIQSQYEAFRYLPIFELVPGSDEEEIETVIRAVYRQVFGNAHIMESERLVVLESQFKGGEISVREFVRQLAQSELYRSRFFENCPRYRFIELNFKHLLGRAPDDYTETFAHSQILDQEGFEAEIDSYIDSDEYQDAFGENIVPYYRGNKTQIGQKLLGYTNTFKLLRGNSGSDKDIRGLANKPRVKLSLMTNTPDGELPPGSALTDVNQLLAAILKPRPPEAIGPTAEELARKEAYQAMRNKCAEQEELLAKLRTQLADLQPLATIGSSELNKWKSNTSYGTTAITVQVPSPVTASVTIEGDYEALEQQSEEQEREIAALREKIADLRPVASIGELRLNKWRGRVFNR